MKIRQFFVICAFKKLPSEIICKIWVYMLDSCVDSIRAVYFRKVEINLHILRIFIDLTADIPSDPLYQYSQYCTIRSHKKYSCEHVNNIVKFHMNKITFEYIWGNVVWSHFLFQLIHVYDDNINLHINNIFFIINNIKSTRWHRRRLIK